MRPFFIDSGSRIVDMMLWPGGSDLPVDVTAYTDGTEDQVESAVSCVGKLDNDVVFSVAFNDAVSGGDKLLEGRGYYTILGDNGVRTADWVGIMATEPSEIWLVREGVRENIEILEDTITPAHGFVAAIRDGASNYAPANEAAQVVALTEAIYRSSEEQQRIRVAQPLP